MRSDMLENYFKNVGKHQLLTREQEVELAQRIEKGDDLARQIMIESNLRLAISVAKKYSRYGSDLEDLIQESNIGLMKAVEKFDWRRGFKFSTYACCCINLALARSIWASSLSFLRSFSIARRSTSRDFSFRRGSLSNCDVICFSSFINSSVIPRS